MIDLALFILAALTVFAGYHVIRLLGIFQDTPFISTPSIARKTIMNAVSFSPSESVIDLGCGDGSLLIDLEKKFNVQPIGIEMRWFPYLLCRLRKIALKSGLQLKRKNILSADLSEAQTIYCYLGTKIMKKLELKFQKELKTGARVLSLSFPLPNRKPEKTIDIPMGWGYKTTLYIYLF